MRQAWSPSTKVSHGGAEASCTSKKTLALAHYIFILLNELYIQRLDFPSSFSFSAQDFLAGNPWMIPLVTGPACVVGWEPLGCSAERGRLRDSSSLVTEMRRAESRRKSSASILCHLQRHECFNLVPEGTAWMAPPPEEMR